MIYEHSPINTQSNPINKNNPLTIIRFGSPCCCGSPHGSLRRLRHPRSRLFRYFQLPSHINTQSHSFKCPTTLSYILEPPMLLLFHLCHPPRCLCPCFCLLAVTSSLSAELIAVASLITYDVYNEYINPKALGADIIRVNQSNNNNTDINETRTSSGNYNYLEIHHLTHPFIIFMSALAYQRTPLTPPLTHSITSLSS